MQKTETIHPNTPMKEKRRQQVLARARKLAGPGVIIIIDPWAEFRKGTNGVAALKK